MTVIEYCTEEVERQGHDTSVLDGIERVGWMLDAWSYALSEPLPGRGPTTSDIEQLGKRIERHKNSDGFRTCGVRVGTRVCPPWPEVVPLLKALLEQWDELKPLDFYREFEMIHPFRDGNGRCGKILMAWKGGTLLDPIFPPNDFWGYPIRNP